MKASHADRDLPWPISVWWRLTGNSPGLALLAPFPIIPRGFAWIQGNLAQSGRGEEMERKRERVTDSPLQHDSLEAETEKTQISPLQASHGEMEFFCSYYC